MSNFSCKSVKTKCLDLNALLLSPLIVEFRREMQRPKNWQIELWVVKGGILCYAHFLLSQSFSPLRSIGSYWQGSLLLLLKSKIAAIVFTMRILCNCLQKLSLLYRLI